MNWINTVVRPKIRGLLTTRREPPEDFWHKCPNCGQMTDKNALVENQHVFPCCGHHGRLTAPERLKAFFDAGAYKTIAVREAPADPLKFRDSKKYVDRLKDARSSTTLQAAVVVGEGTVDGRAVVAAAHDARFMSGSLATAEGEAVVTGMLLAVEKHCPFVLFAASGGARMQEGILSLMQMPRTTIAVQRLREAGLPYIVVLTDPTTGGVTASYAMLGDVHVAEPNALICFAGPRVIQQTIREQLPEGFQRAEYLLEHGMIDMVVHRHQLRETLARLVKILGPQSSLAKAQPKAALVTKSAAKAANGTVVKNGNGNGNGHVNGSHGHTPLPPPADDAEPLAESDRVKPAAPSARDADPKNRARPATPGAAGGRS